MDLGYLWESQKERDQFEVEDVGEWIILKPILESWVRLLLTGLIWLRLETIVSLLLTLQ
jgi:hypothetical protein